MSGLSIEFIFKRPSRTYHAGERVSGFVVVDSKTETKHDGIILSLVGNLSLEVPSKNSSLLDSFTYSAKPTVLTASTIDISKPGKLISGKTKLGFEIPLQAKPNGTLYETYHGVYIIVQYSLKCDIRKSLLSKDVFKTQEFIVEFQSSDVPKALMQETNFVIEPDTLTHIRDRSRIPKFKVVGYLDSLQWPISQPISGQISVVESDRGITSIELQLLRVETCGTTDVNTKEVSEIQNIQIVSGDVVRNLAIPIYLVLPRLFTCSSIVTNNFAIDFELSIVIMFENDYVAAECFPIKIFRH